MIVVLKVAGFVILEIGLGAISKAFFIKEKDGFSVYAATVMTSALIFMLTIVGNAVNSEATAMVSLAVYVYAVALATVSYIIGVKISEKISPPKSP